MKKESYSVNKKNNNPKTKGSSHHLINIDKKTGKNFTSYSTKKNLLNSRTGSTDFKLFAEKKIFSPLNNTKAAFYNTGIRREEFKTLVKPVDLTGFFIMDFEEVKMLLKTVLTNLSVKFIFNSINAFKCEKKGVRFELTISQSKEEGLEGCFILNKRLQGNTFLFKETILSIYKKLNE